MHTPGPLYVALDDDGRPSFLASEAEGLYHKPGATPHLTYRSTFALPSSDLGMGNAKLLAAAYTSYDRHCGPKSIELAESDLLGELIAACRAANEFYDALIDQLYGEGMDRVDEFLDRDDMSELANKFFDSHRKLPQPNGESHVEG